MFGNPFQLPPGSRRSRLQRAVCLAVLLLTVGLPAASFGTSSPAFSELVVIPIDYRVKPGDTIRSIARHFGVDWRGIAILNNLPNPDRIHSGQKLRLTAPRLVPTIQEDGIIINLPEAALYYVEDRRVIFHARVGLGKPGEWRTPRGPFTVVKREQHPTWLVPPSIQHEMEAEGKVVQSQIPPGPDNPLGEFWFGLSMQGYGIHGTIESTSIGQFRSHGCIRMQQDDIRHFYAFAKIGTPGELIYQPVKVGIVRERVYLEVHPDIYGEGVNASAEAKARLKELPLPIDWRLVETVLRKGTGVAEDVTLFPPIGVHAGPRLVQAAQSLGPRDGLRTMSSMRFQAR